MPRNRRGGGGRISTGNPNFKPPADPASVDPTSLHGMNIGGISDAMVRANTNISGVLEMQALRKSRSTGLKP